MPPMNQTLTSQISPEKRSSENLNYINERSLVNMSENKVFLRIKQSASPYEVAQTIYGTLMNQYIENSRHSYHTNHAKVLVTKNASLPKQPISETLNKRKIAPVRTSYSPQGVFDEEEGTSLNQDIPDNHSDEGVQIQQRSVYQTAKRPKKLFQSPASKRYHKIDLSTLVVPSKSRTSQDTFFMPQNLPVSLKNSSKNVQ